VAFCFFASKKLRGLLDKLANKTQVLFHTRFASLAGLTAQP
jgi:hypothetical protein